ncbi:MAG TPA: NlpC/P60 family protein [Streptosporangiaceae bacterium]|nr:NlpC/P60 family protein [Streptosporangiaceae bacterium]
MSVLKPRTIGRLTAAAIPFGIAAVFVFQGAAGVAFAASELPVASAAAAGNQPGAAGPHGSPSKGPLPMRLKAYDWALTQKGHPYEWGGTGPGYDCSGLVMMAYRHAGVHLPRTTYDMLSSPLLVRVKIPKMGDLAFYGDGHVELFRKWGYTYGAHDSGTVVSLIHYGGYWKPTAFYAVRARVRHHKHS